MKKLNLLAFVASIMVGLSGCEKATVENVAAADIYIKAITNAQGNTVYAPIQYVFSYNTMTSVIAKSPTGLTTSLQNYENGGNSFFNEPVDADYSINKPTVGTYTYTVKFDNAEEKIYTNTLSSSSILPANITSLTKNANGDSVYISWNAITDVDAYQILVQKEKKSILETNKLYDASVPKKTSLRFGFRLSDITSGTSATYTFTITGVLYETSAATYIQAISASTKDIVL
jgi:hypothetical protein